MPRRCLLLLVLPLAVLLAPSTGSSADDRAVLHEAVLKEAGLKCDGPALLDFFRKRTLSVEEQTKLAALVRQLGADTFAAHTRASNDLVAAGRKAVSFLKAGADDEDREIARQSRWCLQEIDAKPETSLVLAAAALLALRKPAGAAEVLLAYLPFREDEAVDQDVFEAVLATSVRGGKIEPALRAAARSHSVRQRTAAAWALGRQAKAEDRALALPLLSDAAPTVRFRTAEALVTARDKRGVPALLLLLEKGPADLAAEAEGILTLLAEEKAPAVPLGNDEQERQKCSLAWQGWWRDHGAKLDLAKRDLTERVVGLRLVAANTGYGGKGAVWEYGVDRKNRWELRDVGGPFDARVLPGGRLLIAEYDGKRVTERDRTGKILWEYAPPHAPLEVQRLPNGNTLIATNYEIGEVTRAKIATWIFHDRGGDIFSAQKLPNGHLLYGLYTGAVVELDRTGKESNRFAMERRAGWPTSRCCRAAGICCRWRGPTASWRWIAGARCCARCRSPARHAWAFCRAATCWWAATS